jgi:hypothetical protein
MKVYTMTYWTHNLYDESHWVSRLMENFTSGSDGEGLETGYLVPRQSFTRQLSFKKMKQNFQLHYFYGENENAIRIQDWCTLIAQLLLTVIQKIAQTKKAFSAVASLVRIHLISMLDVNELLRSTNRNYQIIRGSPSDKMQLCLEFKEREKGAFLK